jgi:hypothetical protein
VETEVPVPKRFFFELTGDSRKRSNKHVIGPRLTTHDSRATGGHWPVAGRGPRAKS